MLKKQHQDNNVKVLGINSVKETHNNVYVCGGLYTLLCVSLTLSIPSTLTLLSWLVWKLVHIVVCFFDTINT